jgi:predicted secreted protein
MMAMSESTPPGGGYGAPPPGGGYGSAPPPPGGGYGGPPGSPPPNHLVWAILSTLFCCLPLGIASIVFAAQVNGKYTAGDYAGAQESSRKARSFALWATIIGLALGVLWLVLVVLLGVGSSNNSTGGY